MLHFCRLYIVYVLKDRVECSDMLPLHYPHLHTVDGSPISEPRIQSRKEVMEKILKEGEEMGSSAKDNAMDHFAMLTYLVVQYSASANFRQFRH